MYLHISGTMLNGCTGKCVRLSLPLVGFWTHFKSPHFHSFIHSFSDWFFFLPCKVLFECILCVNWSNNVILFHTQPWKAGF